MSMVGAGAYLMTGGWSYWPVSDYYSLTPKWDESHSVTGEVVYAADEQNRYALVASWFGDEPYFILTVTEDDPETTEVEEDIPYGVPILTGRIWVPNGWAKEYPLQIDLVVEDELDDDGNEVWTGDVRVLFTDAVRQAVWYDRVAKFVVDLTFEGSTAAAIRLAFGEAVFRR